MNDREKLTVPSVRGRKRRDGAEALVMVTAYDEPFGRLADAAGVDLILVGDTLGEVVLGYDDTLHVTIEDVERAVGAVSRAQPAALVIGDMPWLSYHLGPAEAVRNAARLIRAGAGAVKLEGGRSRLEVVSALVRAEIPVMGHLGLTPQSVHQMGGYRLQGREVSEAMGLVDEAYCLAEAGVFAIVLEGVPAAVAELVTEKTPVPTIGIGAGPDCDGQVLVIYDLLGLSKRPPARFVRRYAELGETVTEAVRRYADDVRKGSFPTNEESYHGSKALREALGLEH